MTTASAETSSAIIEHKECVFDAIKETFTQACSFDLTDQDTPSADQSNGEGAIISVISLVGDVEWSMTLGMHKSTAVVAVEKFCGMEISFESDDMGDAIGELANIAAGATKTKLDQYGIKANLSLPAVVRGEHMQALYMRNLPSVIQYFGSECGIIWSQLVVGTNIIPTKQSGG